MIAERIRRLLRRNTSYKDCFQEADGKTLTLAGAYVIKDLARFCGAYKSNMPTNGQGSVDTHAMAVAEGRRQVYLRIVAQLSVTEADILKANEEQT